VRTFLSAAFISLLRISLFCRAYSFSSSASMDSTDSSCQSQHRLYKWRANVWWSDCTKHYKYTLVVPTENVASIELYYEKWEYKPIETFPVIKQNTNIDIRMPFYPCFEFFWVSADWIIFLIPTSHTNYRMITG
jgi:hypothetical protein